MGSTAPALPRCGAGTPSSSQPPPSSSPACDGSDARRRRWALLCVLACMLLLQLAGVATRPRLPRARRSRALQETPDAATPLPGQCSSDFGAFLPSIYEDLLPWSSSGITARMMDAAFEESYERGTAGLPVVIKGGRVFIAGRGQLAGVYQWFARELVIYAHVLQQLERAHGGSLPDAEFLIRTDDETEHDYLSMLGLLKGGAIKRAPVFRFCRGEDNAEVLIPIWHLYEHHFSRSFIAQAQGRNQQHPWESRTQQLFSVPGGYHRHISHEQHNQKFGHQGQTLTMPREEIATWAQAANDSRLNISNSMWLEIGEWSRYRWVAHVDGITCSSRLEKLLSLGSLVLKEESGYRAFYHRMLQPFVHYVPFWRHRPQEALQAVDWAQAHDAQAAGIARAGQALVTKYLSKPALECYWLMLLHEWSKLLRYSPAAPDRNHTSPLLPVGEWLQQVKEHHGPEIWVDAGVLELEEPRQPQGQWQ